MEKETLQVNTYEVGQYARVVDDLFPEKTMDVFYKICQTLDFEDMGVGGNQKPEINKEIRNTKGIEFTRYSKKLTHVHWCNYFSTLVAQEILYQYKTIAPHIHFKKSNMIQVLKYEEGGFYIPHVDHFHSIPRTMSVVIFVNDNFEGGDFEMFSPDNKESQKIKPKKGRTIMFPSNFLYPHKANVVTKGTRYIIVIWNL
jgi:Rps23 Pro-64 3,4-dihydroxylase Tpa1-like proline 4-hydroxylase